MKYCVISSSCLALAQDDAYTRIMKELLDLLEERVNSLLGEVQALRRENDQLRRDLADKVAPLADENASLKNALAEEQTTRETAARRIDALLRRLSERMPE